MHTLIISQIFPPDMGGSATRAYNVAKGLLANDIDVTVIAGFPHYPTGNVPKEYRKRALVTEYVGRIKVIRTFVPPLPSKGLTRRFFLFASFIISSVFPLAFVKKIDGVFASNPQILSIFPALVYGTVFRCPVLLNVDDLWPESLYDLGMLKSKALRIVGELIAKVAYSTADIVVPISPSYVETIVNKYGKDRRKVSVVPGGVDLNLFSSQDKKVKEGGEFKVLYIGAFSPAYNFDQVLKAAKLLENEEKIKIILLGGGEMALAIREKIKRLNVRNVELIEKVVSREEAAKIMMDADALLLPLSGLENVEKGISSKLYEYQAACRPIICCSSGQPGRYVLETNSGIVVKPGDFESLVKAILYLKENKDMAEKLGASGREFVVNNMSIEKIGSKMIAVFNKSSWNQSKVMSYKRSHDMKIL